MENKLLHQLVESGWKYIGYKELDYKSDFDCENCHFHNLVNIFYVKDLSDDRIYKLGVDCYTNLKDLTSEKNNHGKKHMTFEEREEYSRQLTEKWDRNWHKKNPLE